MYRGCAMPELHGTYFFADYCREQIWSFRYTGGVVTEFQERTTELDPAGAQQVNSPASFGEDAFGELYICDITGGEVFKIIPQAPGPDCNETNLVDTCDIALGTSEDTNANSIPDECEVVIPTVSEFGVLATIVLLALVGATMIIRRQHKTVTS